MSEENKYTITMWQGADFGLTLNLRDSSEATMNLAGYSAAMQIRQKYASTTVSESLTTANGEITLSANTGEMILELSASRTSNIAVDRNCSGKPPRNTYVYDLELTDTAGKITKLMYGEVIVYAEVTR